MEIIDTADAVDDSGLFEIEPVNEIIIGRNVNLRSMVKSSVPETSIWFAQVYIFSAYVHGHNVIASLI